MGNETTSFDFFKGKKMIIRFVLTKTTSFRFMSVRLIGRNSIRFGSAADPVFGIKFYTDYRTEISR
jgi:hypothetical protein